MEIGVWGDSITYGRNDSEGLGWVGRLRRTFPEDGIVDVYNRGICGDTSEDLSKRFSVEAESIEPHVIIFAIGINDSKFPQGSETNKVSIEAFKTNIQSLIAQAKTHTEKVFIVGCTKVDDNRIGPGSRFDNSEIEKYNHVLQTLAAEASLKFIDVFDVLDPDIDLYDGLHPNAQGYEKLAKVIKPQLVI